jgi:hypothetical protein
VSADITLGGFRGRSCVVIVAAALVGVTGPWASGWSSVFHCERAIPASWRAILRGGFELFEPVS